MVWAQLIRYLVTCSWKTSCCESNCCSLGYPTLLSFNHSPWHITLFLDLLCFHFFSQAGVPSTPLPNFLPLPIHPHRKVPTKCHFFQENFLTTLTCPTPTTFTQTCLHTHHLHLQDIGFKHSCRQRGARCHHQIWSLLSAYVVPATMVSILLALSFLLCLES